MTAFRHACRRFRREERGVAAVEFALIAPVLIIAALGISEAGRLLLKYRHAVQAAASLAETSARLSVVNRSNDASETANTITSEQAALLSNGLKLVMGKEDARAVSASAQRVVRSKGKLKVDWSWRYGERQQGSNDDGKDDAKKYDEKEVMSLTNDGESIVVVDVAFDHKFLFDSFGMSKRITAHYSAGVPSY